MTQYKIPAQTHRHEIEEKKSKFISTISLATTTDEAKDFISKIRQEMPDANHHVYAFRVGFGNSVTEGMSDDGEPSGTSGPPTLAVLRGADIGDIVLVTTRYFGGTKLGKGGLVRAYTLSAQLALENLPIQIKASKTTVRIRTPYPLYEIMKRHIIQFNGHIQDEVFQEDVSILVEFLDEILDDFYLAARETSSGTIVPTVVSKTDY